MMLAAAREKEVETKKLVVSGERIKNSSSKGICRRITTSTTTGQKKHEEEQ